MRLLLEDDEVGSIITSKCIGFPARDRTCLRIIRDDRTYSAASY